MLYSLKKIDDNYCGDSGPMSMLLWKDGEEIKTEFDTRPRVGCSIRVGSYTARSYQRQDWYQTSIITNILIDEEDYVKFSTLNSIYEWKKYA